MSDLIKNPDPKRYVIRKRKGRDILVDKQIIRYQRYYKRPIEKLPKRKLGRPKRKPLDIRDMKLFK